MIKKTVLSAMVLIAGTRNNRYRVQWNGPGAGFPRAL